MKITVFTPTYNRAYIIENLYRSLQRQTCHDFEWLVVDDGSSDNTKELFDIWQKEENPFPIRYYYKENGGKHRAINYAVLLAVGEVFFIVDSDDYLTDDAVAVILNQFLSLPQNSEQKFAGICNCRGYSLTEIMGTTFGGRSIDCTSLERTSFGIEGDKAEVFYTHILRKYPFPEFENEKFITEAVVWDRIAADGYKLRFFNKIIYIGEYRKDGLTSQGLDLYHRNPLGYALYLNQARKYHKFSAGVQRYFDVEFYLSCKKRMSLQEISERLGIPAVKLIPQVVLYKMRLFAGKIKRMIISK